MADIQSATAEIGCGKKKERRWKKPQGLSAPAAQDDHDDTISDKPTSTDSILSIHRHTVVI